MSESVMPCLLLSSEGILTVPFRQDVSTVLKRHNKAGKLQMAPEPHLRSCTQLLMLRYNFEHRINVFVKKEGRDVGKYAAIIFRFHCCS